MKKVISMLLAVLLMATLALPTFATGGPSVYRPTPVEVEELPDPNEPGAPDFVAVVPPADASADVEPEVFVRVEDPESPNPEEPEYVYVPEAEVPLASVPSDEGKDKDTGKSVKDIVEEGIGMMGVAETAHSHFGDPACWTILILSALGGLIVGVIVGRMSKKGKKDDRDDNEVK